MNNLNLSILSEDKERKISSGNFRSIRGKEKIYLKMDIPQKKECDFHILIIHDLGEYHDRYQEVADFLINKYKDKVSVSWLDLYGHGFSGGTRAHIDIFERYCEDIAYLVSSIQNESSKVILLGQGLGGIIAIKLHQFYSHLLKYPLTGMILANPALKFHWEVPKIIQNLIGAWQGDFLKLKLPFLLDGHLLSSDKEKGEEFNSDPLISKSITVGLFNEITKAGGIARGASYFLDIPTLILISEKDILYRNEVTKLFSKGVPRDYSSVIEYSKMRHDLFNEVNREKVFQDVYNWLKKHPL